MKPPEHSRISQYDSPDAWATVRQLHLYDPRLMNDPISQPDYRLDKKDYGK
jgi:hypothetical protein